MSTLMSILSGRGGALWSSFLQRRQRAVMTRGAAVVCVPQPPSPQMVMVMRSCSSIGASKCGLWGMCVCYRSGVIERHEWSLRVYRVGGIWAMVCGWLVVSAAFT